VFIKHKSFIIDKREPVGKESNNFFKHAVSKTIKSIFDAINNHAY